MYYCSIIFYSMSSIIGTYGRGNRGTLNSHLKHLLASAELNLKKSIDFYKTLPNVLLIDGIFGIRLATDYLKEIQKILISLTSRLRKKKKLSIILTSVNETTNSQIHQLGEIIRSVDKEEFSDSVHIFLRMLLNHEGAYTNHTLPWQIFEIDKKMKFSNKMDIHFDKQFMRKCIINLKENCKTFKRCLKYADDGLAYGSERLLYSSLFFLLIEQSNCLSVVTVNNATNNEKRRKIGILLLNDLISKRSDRTSKLRTTFLQEIVFIGLYGLEKVFTKSIFKRITVWQNSFGCFEDKHSVEKDKEFAHDMYCNSEMTGFGIAALAAYKLWYTTELIERNAYALL
ncbi:hypothetical protein SNEBB_010195 [Seison nebaliae]|nr:hypothetical protein SNEBB_010195 [Seison nebaliae]